MNLARVLFTLQRTTTPHAAMARACLVLGAVIAAASAAATPEPVDLPLPMPAPPPRLYSFPDAGLPNTTVSVGPWSSSVAAGALAWPHVDAATTPPARFTLVPGLLSRDEVAALLDIVRDNPELEVFDEDADSVDGASTHEFYIEAAGSVASLAAVPGKPDTDPAVFAARAPHRARLSALLRPVIDGRIVPFVNAHVPSCGGGRADAESGAALGAGGAVGRAKGGVGCSVCQALVRRYRHGERLSHATHFDVQALVTVVVSLSSYGKDHTGGLFLTTGAEEGGGSGEVFLALQPGDAAVHQSDLLHGVRVLPPEDKEGEGGPEGRLPERWSFIMWFKDGDRCGEAEVGEWAREGAEHGNAVAAFLQARRSKGAGERINWLRRAADGGLARAANELGMELVKNASAVEEGERWVALAAERGEADAVHNLGVRALARKEASVAVGFFRRAAALGHADAAFNLGVAAYNGMGGVRKDLETARAWFEASGLPKGLFLAYQIAREGGDAEGAGALLLRAAKSGHSQACLELAKETLAGKAGPKRTKGEREAEGRRWLKCAARGGHVGAKQVLEQMGAA
jgi:hypothetical protein